MNQYQTFPNKPGGSKSAEKLKKLMLPNMQGKSLLDVGCNEGYFCGFAKYSGASVVVGIDSSASYINNAQKRFPDCVFLERGWETLPTEHFDVIIMLSALHYANDQPAMIDLLVNNLTENGVLILEIGVVNSEKSEWVKIKRSIDERFFPTFPMVEEILKPYAWKLISRSVDQAGDPIPRYVFHISKRKPVAYLLIQDPGTGKSTLAKELSQIKGTKLFQADGYLEKIANGKLPASTKIKTIVEDFFSHSAIDQVYRKIFEEKLEVDFFKPIMSKMSGNDLLLDMYVPPLYRNNVIALIESFGYMPVTLSWARPQFPFIKPSETEKLVNEYEEYLDSKSLGESTKADYRARGCVDSMKFDGDSLFISGWAVDNNLKLPKNLTIRCGNSSYTVPTGAPIFRNDVKDHLGLQSQEYGFFIKFKLNNGESITNLSENSISVRFASGENLHISKDVLK